MRRWIGPALIAAAVLAVVAFVVCTELFGTAWMNWRGWPWVFAPIQAAIGFYFGWDARGVREKHRRWREDFERRRQQGDVGP